jgi:hypothetical protein
MAAGSGTALMTQLEAARANIARLRQEVPTRKATRDRLQRMWARLLDRLDEREADLRETKRELAATKDRLSQLAVDAYTQGASSRVGIALSSMFSANDIVDAGRDLALIDQYGSREDELATDYEEQRREYERDLDRMQAQRVDLRGRLDAAEAKYDGAVHAYETAKLLRLEAREGLKRFHVLAVNSASPILGPNRLTAGDLAAFVLETGHRPKVSVPIEELARLFIQESAQEHVRGDVAWAQSILETGWFGYKGSMVERHDNNFAGIGACDSCQRGLVFPDARTGVRAQVQALKIYADADYGPENAAHEIIRPGMLDLGFRGDADSWFDLTGTWATARNYGPRVYDIYLQMVEFARARAGP